MKILVTGASGQIGVDLVKALREEGHHVIATDVADLDVTSAGAVHARIGDERPDAVHHLAAILSARGEQAPQKTYEVNQTGTYNILEACRVHGVAQVLFTSTIAVYGPGLPDPTPDDVPLHPTTMYGVTKAASELLCEYYWHRYRLDTRGVRFPGLISATLPGGGTSDYALLMYYQGAKTGRYEAFCRADTRIPLMYMPDAVRALRELAAAPRERLSRCVYNVTAMSPTAREIADDVARALPGVDITFNPDPTRQAILDSWPRALDDSAARRDWGWRATYDLAQMTDDLVPRLDELLER